MTPIEKVENHIEKLKNDPSFSGNFPELDKVFREMIKNDHLDKIWKFLCHADSSATYELRYGTDAFYEISVIEDDKIYMADMTIQDLLLNVPEFVMLTYYPCDDGSLREEIAFHRLGDTKMGKPIVDGKKMN